MRPSNAMLVIPACSVAIAFAGCAVAPSETDRPAFVRRARDSTAWFKRRVPGLDGQIAKSAGYAVFPEHVQWGMLVSGGSYGRGVVYDPEGTPIGWASISGGSLGAQFGMQGFSMLLVFESEAVLKRFQSNQLFGTANSVAIASKSGGCQRASFDNGVAIYECAHEGLMLGVNLGLNMIRHEPLSMRERERLTDHASQIGANLRYR